VVLDSSLGWVALLVLVVVLIVVLGVIALSTRRRLLQRDGGFDVNLRLHPGRWGGGWVFGIGRYDGDRILWFRTFGIGLRPRRVFRRRDLDLVERNNPGPEDGVHVPPGHVVLTCRYADDLIDITMDALVVTGFVSWLEAAPPGEHVIA
jgi:Protein of unknown function (DUF2550)